MNTICVNIEQRAELRMSNYNLEEWRRNRPPQPDEMSPEREAMYRTQRANKPILNQAGTFMHGGGTWDDWDYDFPDEVDFDAQMNRDDLMQSSTGWGPLDEAMHGRFDDSMMRDVGGERAHVNPQEARLIDNYGAKGEEAVMNMGSGTINPVTGKKEYSLILAGMAVSALGAGLAARAKNKGLKAARKKQRQQMKDIKAYEQMGEEFMDPESQRNRMYLQNIQQQSANQMALQNQMAQRNAAAQGGGGFSGATAAAQQQAGLQSGLQGRQQWLGMMSQQQNTGLGILGSALRQKGGIRDTVGELEIARGQAAAQGWQSAATGLTGGMGDYASAGGSLQSMLAGQRAPDEGI